MKQKVQFKGLTCGACQKLITNRVKKIIGVKDVIVELNGNAEIKVEREIRKEEIVKVLEGTKYTLL
jgi:copper chaperone CopZ